MLNVKRYPGNPILKPRPELRWRGSARNPGVVYDGKKFHMLSLSFCHTLLSRFSHVQLSVTL